MTRKLLSLGVGALLFGGSVLTMAVTAEPAAPSCCASKAACTRCEMCKGGTCTCEDCAGCCGSHCASRS